MTNLSRSGALLTFDPRFIGKTSCEAGTPAPSRILARLVTEAFVLQIRSPVTGDWPVSCMVSRVRMFDDEGHAFLAARFAQPLEDAHLLKLGLDITAGGARANP